MVVRNNRSDGYSMVEEVSSWTLVTAVQELDEENHDLQARVERLAAVEKVNGK